MDDLVQEAGRAANAVVRSAMVGTFLARSTRDLDNHLLSRERSVEQALEGGVVTGTPEMWVDQLRQYVNA
jgi:hypothetical protein